MTHTLTTNGIPSIHCHRLQNHTVKMETGLFAEFLASYHQYNARKLGIVTVFREPLERHVSSFFQWHGHGVITAKQKKDIASTIIFSQPIPDLQETFVKEVEEQTLVGRRESIDEICEELNLKIANLKYDTDKEHGLIEMENCCIYSFRFDILFGANKFEDLVSRMAGKPIIKRDANLSASKWYKDILLKFKQTLHIPRSTIVSVYESKRLLIEHFYPGQYEYLLTQAISRYT